MEILLMSAHSVPEMRRQYNKSSATRLRWTPQLHDLFIQTVQHLGGRYKATPKRIMEMMAVKGLKISHVKSHLQMYRNMKGHDCSLHFVMPEFNPSTPLHVSNRLRKNAPKKESGSQFSSKESNSSDKNGENIHHYDNQEEEEGSLSSGMTKEEEEDELPQANDGECEIMERHFWPLDDHQNSHLFNSSNSFFDQQIINSSITRENTHVNLDLSLSSCL